MTIRLTDDERTAAVDLYRNGLTLAQVGARIGRSPHAVRCALVDAGIPRRPRNQSTLTAGERAEIIRLYANEQLSTYAIADLTGRSQALIWKTLVDAGTPRRRAGWPGRTRHTHVPPECASYGVVARAAPAGTTAPPPPPGADSGGGATT